MDYGRRTFAWMSFALVAGPLTALAQFPESQSAPPPQQQQQQQQPRQPQALEGSPRPSPVNDVVATVNGDPITQGEVRATLEPQLQGREVDPQVVQRMQQQVVETLVESRLVEQYVAKNGPSVSPEEVKGIMEQIERELAAQQIQLPQFLASRGHTMESFQKRLEGSVAWQKFQQEQLSDENLARYFQQNQERFQVEQLDDARQEVANAYLDELWQSIIGQMKPEAEVQQVASPQARPGLEGAPPAPR